MAFNNDSTAPVQFPTGERTGNQSWKADAFINVYFPRKDESKAKLGYIALKLDRKTDKQLIEFIESHDNPEAALEAIKSRIVLTYAKADGSDSAELDLG